MPNPYLEGMRWIFALGLFELGGCQAKPDRIDPCLVGRYTKGRMNHPLELAADGTWNIPAAEHYCKRPPCPQPGPETGTWRSTEITAAGGQVVLTPSKTGNTETLSVGKSTFDGKCSIAGYDKL